MHVGNSSAENGAGRRDYYQGGYDWQYHNGFDVADVQDSSIDLTDRTAPGLAPNSTATDADLVPWATTGDAAAVSGSGVSASALVTPQLARLRDGGMQRVLLGLTPGHAYHVTWKRKFPQDKSCSNASLASSTAYLSRLRLKASVDNLVLWSQTIAEEASTEAYKIKAAWVAGDELHFVAGWERATLAFETTPLLDDGCALALSDVFVEAKGSFQATDLLSTQANPLVDEVGLATMVTGEVAAGGAVARSTGADAAHGEGHTPQAFCAAGSTTAAAAGNASCAELAGRLAQCAVSARRPLQLRNIDTLVAAANPTTCGACSGSFGNDAAAATPLCPAPPAVVSHMGPCTLTMEVSANVSGVRDPGADAYDLVDAANVRVGSDWYEVESMFANNKITGPDGIVVTYTATDSAGQTSSATRRVFLVDQTPPVLELAGNFTAANPLVVESGRGYQGYQDPGVRAMDAVDGNLTRAVVVDGGGAIDGNVPGDFVVSFSVSDQSGNAATATRHVRVVSSDASRGGGGAAGKLPWLRLAPAAPRRPPPPAAAPARRRSRPHHPLPAALRAQGVLRFF